MNIPMNYSILPNSWFSQIYVQMPWMSFQMWSEAGPTSFRNICNCIHHSVKHISFKIIACDFYFWTPSYLTFKKKFLSVKIVFPYFFHFTKRWPHSQHSTVPIWGTKHLYTPQVYKKKQNKHTNYPQVFSIVGTVLDRDSEDQNTLLITTAHRVIVPNSLLPTYFALLLQYLPALMNTLQSSELFQNTFSTCYVLYVPIDMYYSFTFMHIMSDFYS